MANYNLKEGSVQWGFHQSRAQLQIFGGGFGNGKTTALVIKALKVATEYPGANMLLGRATYPKLNDTLRKEFFRWCPSDWVRRMPTKDDNTCYMHNGTVVNFRYISQRGKLNVEGDTTSNLLSATYDFIGVDQVEDPEIEHKDILDLFGRRRGQAGYIGEDKTMPSTGPRWIILTCNPNMGWVYQELVKPFLLWKKTGRMSPELLVDEETNVPIMELYEGSTMTNAANLPADFIKGLRAAYKGQNYDRFVLGKWASYEGLVYEGYNPDVNRLTYDQIMDHLINCIERHVKVQVIEGYDFGLQSPSCYGLGFVDDFGRVFILDGYYKPNFSYEDQPREINKIRAKYNNLLNFEDAIRADPDIFRKKVIAGKRDTGSTVAKLLSVKGLTFRPASNIIESGIAKVSAYINGKADMPHPITGALGSPMLYIVDDLDWFNDEIMNYFWTKNTHGQRIDKPQDTKDHAMDMTKYMLCHLPAPSEVELPVAMQVPGWTKWHEAELNT